MLFKKSVSLSLGILLYFNTVHGMDIETGNSERFEKIKQLLDNFRWYGKRLTTFSERREYGYNGMLTPIVKDPEIIRVGFIIEDAQPSMWWGYWYADSCMPKNLICLEDNSLKFEAEIKNDAATNSIIRSSCIFSDGPKNCISTKAYNLAILWEVSQQLKVGAVHNSTQQEFYVTIQSLQEIEKNNNIFDLDKDKIAVTLHSACYQ